MKRTWKSCLAALTLTASAAFGQYASWSGDYIPQSVEVTPTFTSAGEESAPLLVVYLNGIPYVAPYEGDKAKGWFEMIKSAVQSGKRINVFWDPNYLPEHTFCADFDYDGACTYRTTSRLRRIQRVSMKP